MSKHQRREQRAPKVGAAHRSGPKQAARWQYWTVAAAAALAILVYVNSLQGGFVWDDQNLIVDDRAVKSWQHLGEIFSNDFFDRNEDDLPYGYYRPVTTVSYLIDYTIWALHPFGYHLTNVLLHAACTAMVAVLLINLGWSLRATSIAAFLFAVHPIHTENVAWVAGRTDLLSFFFCAVALALHLVAMGSPSTAANWRVDERRKETRSSTPHGRPRARFECQCLLLGLSSLAFALALLSKEMSVILPVWMVLVHVVAYRQSWRSSLRAVVPYLIVLCSYCVWRFAVIHVGVPGKPSEHGLLTVLLSTGPTVVRYLGWMLLPMDLNAYVSNPYVTDLADPRLLGSLCLLAPLSLLLYRVARHSTGVLLVSSMLVSSFLPILNLARVAGPLDMGNVMAERFCYFPSFPFMALAGLAIGALLDRTSTAPQARRLLCGGLMGIIILASLVTISRNRVWRNELTFLTETLSQSPNAVLLWGNLANYHLDKGNLEEASKAIEEAESLDPNSYSVLSSRALWYVIAGRTSEAIPLQQRITREAASGRKAALNNLAYLYRITGQYDRALDILERLVRDDHAYADVHFNLAEVHRARGEIERARTEYRLALKDRPNGRQIATALASLELDAGRTDVAEGIYRQLLKSYPDDVGILNNIALTRHRMGDVQEALELLNRVVSIQPEYVKGRINYAHLLHGVGRTKEALAQLEVAMRLSRGTQLEQLVAQDLAAMRTGRSPGAAGTDRPGNRLGNDGT